MRGEQNGPNFCDSYLPYQVGTKVLYLPELFMFFYRFDLTDISSSYRAESCKHNRLTQQPLCDYTLFETNACSWSIKDDSTTRDAFRYFLAHIFLA